MQNLNLNYQNLSPQANEFANQNFQNGIKVGENLAKKRAAQEKHDKHNAAVPKRRKIAKIIGISAVAGTIFVNTSAGQNVINKVGSQTGAGIEQVKKAIYDATTDGDSSNRTFKSGDAAIMKKANLRESPVVVNNGHGETNSEDELNRTLYVDKSDIHYVKTDNDGKWYKIPGEAFGGTDAKEDENIYVNGQNIDFNPKEK